MLTDDSAGADMFAEGCRDETNGRSYSTIVHDTETYLLCANCGAVVSVETGYTSCPSQRSGRECIPPESVARHTP